MFNPKTLAAVVAALIVVEPLAAEGAAVVSGRAEITDFSVKLTDLKPNDLIPASLKVGSGGADLTLSNQVDLSGVYVSSPDDRNTSTQGVASMIDGAQLQDQAVLNGGLSQASKNGGSLTAQISADASTFANVPFGFYRGASEGAQIYSSVINTGWWTLSGNTDAIFTGTIRLQADADVASLSNLPSLQSTGVAGTVNASVITSMQAMRDGQVIDSMVQDDSGYFESSSGIFHTTATLTFSDAVPPPGWNLPQQPVEDSFLERTFEIHVRNTSSQALDLYWTNYISIQGRVGPLVNKTALPEPGTWAMMGLGFGLMAWRVRVARSAIRA